MSSPEPNTASPPPDVASELRASVDGSEFHNLEQLRALIDEGIASGPGVDACEVFDALRAKYGA